MSKVIEGGTVLTTDRMFVADVLTEGGRITAIGADLGGETVIVAPGCYLMPGGIDPHVNSKGLGNRPLGARLCAPCPVIRELKLMPNGV